MPIIWDERKRLLNIARHGIDFALAQTEFDFNGALYTPSREGRIKAVGLHRGRVCVLIFKPLGEEAISLISLRIASKKERNAYGRQT